MKWYECKIQYDKTFDNGEIKAVKEAYLLDALSFTESEEKIIRETEPYMSGEFSVTDIKQSKITEIIDSSNPDDDLWYKAKIGFISVNEKTGKEKVYATYYLVKAKNIKKSLEYVEKNMEGTTSDYKVISIAETPFIDVIRNELDGKDGK